MAHGADGLDEVSTTGYTKISECRGGIVRTFYLHPTDFGLPVTDLATLRAESPEESVAIARGVLAGDAGPARDMVLANAAAGLVITERVESLHEGVATAAAALDDGRAGQTLTRLAAVSNDGTGGER